jgi:branched-chain amino acid transport system ATP-binding protein
MSILEVREVSVRFGGHMAVDGVDLHVEPATVTGLIGPNGAGKTTLFNVITGLQTPTSGRVFLDGDDITKAPAHRRARAGIARTFQRLELFGTLSVFDNVRTAAEVHRSDEQTPEHAVEAILAEVGLADLASVRADALSTGNARLVELARALACRPRVLLLDEPASGLDETETEAFAGTLRRLADGGLAILLVEHDVPLVLSLCSDITVLNFGTVLASGTADEIRHDEAVIEAYLGQSAEVGGAS